MDIIDLCSSEEDEPKCSALVDLRSSDEDEPPKCKRKAPAASSFADEPRSKRALSTAGKVREDAGEDEVVLDAPPSRAHAAATAATAVASGGVDDDVQLVSETGNALSDYPHSRHNCVNFPFAKGNHVQACVNCYCYVCDTPQRECKHWTIHCSAFHDEQGSGKWYAMRKAMIRKKSGVTAATAPERGPFWDSANDSDSDSDSDCDNIPFLTADEVLRRVRQVFPVEAPKPPGMVVAALRPYQKQCIAFMLRNERSAKGSEFVGQPSNVGADFAHNIRGGWLASEVGMGKTACCIGLILSNPSTEPRATDAQWKAAFVDGGARVKVKTTIVFAPNTLLGQWRDELKKFAPELNVLVDHCSVPKNQGNCTGMFKDSNMTNFTLTGPSQLRDCDVLLTAPTKVFSKVLFDRAEFHRLIIDEVHVKKNLMVKGLTSYSELGTPESGLPSFPARLRWGVTATPFTHVDDLYNWTRVLRQEDKLCFPDRYCYRWKNTKENHEIAIAQLRRLMIRHTKDMRIGGAAALALPVLNYSTVWLKMSPFERKYYTKIKASKIGLRHWLNEARQSEADPLDNPSNDKYRVGVDEIDDCCSSELTILGADYFAFVGPYCKEPSYQSLKNARSDAARLSKTLYEKLQADGKKGVSKIIPAGVAIKFKKYGVKNKKDKHHFDPLVYVPKLRGDFTKINALRMDLTALVAKEPYLHAVVFTASPTMQYLVCKMCQDLLCSNITLYTLNRKVPPKQRHTRIRKFQELEKKPKIFVMTYETGSCGMTLTAASHIFLMEPSVNPSVEHQAAGRIHRLGQSKEVFIKRFCFRNTIEEKIVAFHGRIKAGSVDIVDGQILLSELAKFV